MSCTFDCLWIILKCDVSNHRLLKPLWLESQHLSFNPDVQKRAFYVGIYILEENKTYLSHSRARLNHLHSRLFRRSDSSQTHIYCSCTPPVLVCIDLKKTKKNKA